MKKLSEYLITRETMLISPIHDEYGNLHSMVTEELTSYIVEKSPRMILKDSCCYNGSTFAGRKDSTIAVTGYQSKIPICISEIQRIFFFPLESPKNEMCHWVSHYHVDRVEAGGPEQSLIIFCNKIGIHVPYSKGIVFGNLSRTAQFRSLMLRRWGEE
ncbi:competence protein ComK [Alkalihalobacillus sp. MEB130]|uniref:competence protein ComK n=1 Tax=Alkalihalobacillus sp. MEB130 TaxID=2976704 RepID=UPI0028DDCB58|nr:competence protein ComK [Alkalihalobacillus sp. MEB130]MDT8862977.1 competence protein ComK [Alkalihalobacillus sp. MEB130]